MTDESPLPRIEPPEGSGWTVHGPHGLHRFKEGPDGRVVRLADVVRWLVSVRELPLAIAVGRVCDALEGDAPPLVYRINANGWAVPGDSTSEWFKFLSGKPGEPDIASMAPRAAHAWLAARDMRATLLMAPHDLARCVNGNGPGEIEYDSKVESPIEFFERRGGNGVIEAVDFATAHALWGWGTVAAPATLADTAPAARPAVLGPDDVKDYETLVRYRRQFLHLAPQKREKWPPEHIDIASAEVQARGRGGKTSVAKELGYPTASGLNSVFEWASKRAAEQAARDAERAKESAFVNGLGQRSKAA